MRIIDYDELQDLIQQFNGIKDLASEENRQAIQDQEIGSWSTLDELKSAVEACLNEMDQGGKDYTEMQMLYTDLREVSG